MAADLRRISAEEMRLRNYREQVNQKHRSDIKDLQDQHDDRVTNLLEDQNFQMEKIRNAYEVKISAEAERLEEMLHDVRINNRKRVEQAKIAGEAEVEAVELRNKKLVEEEKQQAQERIDTLRKELKYTLDNYHKQAKKEQRRIQQNKESQS